MKRKVKLKAKGKRFYKNTHGKVYRVKGKCKTTKQELRKQKRLNDQIKI